MKIVFFGTPEYVLPVLESLHKAFKTKRGESPIAAVVTQRPRPSGRKQILTYSAVDSWANKKRLPLYFKAEDLIKAGVKAEVGILTAYGELISKSAINYFPFGILNIHPSLLPKFRGASPVQATLVSGESAGVSIIKIDEKMDHGPIVSQFKEGFDDDDTTGSLRQRLFERSAEVLVTLLPAYLKGKITPRPQKHEKATFTNLLKKDHGFIDPQGLKAAVEGKSINKKWKIEFIKNYTSHYSPATIHRFIRAMQPWPIAWTLLHQDFGRQTKRLKILKAHLKKSNTNQQTLIIDEVQLEGKNPVSVKQFREAYKTAILG